MKSQEETIENLKKRLDDVEAELNVLREFSKETKFLAKFGCYTGKMVGLIATTYEENSSSNWDDFCKELRKEKRAAERKMEKIQKLALKPFHKELCAVLLPFSYSLENYYAWVGFSGNRNEAFHSGISIMKDERKDEKIKQITESLSILEGDIPVKYAAFKDSLLKAVAYELSRVQNLRLV